MRLPYSLAMPMGVCLWAVADPHGGGCHLLACLELAVEPDHAFGCTVGMCVPAGKPDPVPSCTVGICAPAFVPRVSQVLAH